MALADEIDFTGMDFITAFVAGYEVETLLAEMSGFDHYDKVGTELQPMELLELRQLPLDY